MENSSNLLEPIRYESVGDVSSGIPVHGQCMRYGAIRSLEILNGI